MADSGRSRLGSGVCDSKWAKGGCRPPHAHRPRARDFCVGVTRTQRCDSGIPANGVLCSLLQSASLRHLAAACSRFLQREKPVAAICHGVVLAARSKIQATGQSVLHGYKTTSLLQTQEMLAFRLTTWWMGDYYLTYPGVTVEAEVRQALACSADFQRGPTPLLRDAPKHLERGFWVRDRHYLSARWPGDLYAFSREFVEMIRPTRG